MVDITDGLVCDSRISMFMFEYFFVCTKCLCFFFGRGERGWINATHCLLIFTMDKKILVWLEKMKKVRAAVNNGVNSIGFFGHFADIWEAKRLFNTIKLPHLEH